ncbi:MAG TPA: hypothetical protein VGR37_24755, partial [Longimicrobiaceae bacterium]|nr:hypothetical protein [Longimicrobiaceae bacterium]
VVTDTSSHVVVTGMDWLGPQMALAGVQGPRFAPRGPGLGRPAERPALPPSPVRATPAGAEGEVRTVRLAITPGSWFSVNVRIPADRLAGWSFSDTLPPLPAQAPAAGQAYTLRAYPSGQGWEGTLRIRGAEPVTVEVQDVYAPGGSPAVDEVVRQLPDWVTPTPTLVRRTALTF